MATCGIVWKQLSVIDATSDSNKLNLRFSMSLAKLYNSYIF